ncbi:unnamed protein product [Closterium sp. NIES-54]
MWRRGLSRARLVLGSPLPSSASTSSTSAAAASTASTPTATATAASTSTAATEAPTSATTPTLTPSSASTATTSSPATSFSALAVVTPLARSRRSDDRLGANKVDSSSRGNGGQKRNGGAPLKERGTGVTTRGSYSGNTSLCCKDALLEEVDSEGGRAMREEVVPDRAKGVRESGD